MSEFQVNSSTCQYSDILGNMTFKQVKLAFYFILSFQLIRIKISLINKFDQMLNFSQISVEMVYAWNNEGWFFNSIWYVNLEFGHKAQKHGQLEMLNYKVKL